MRNKEKMRTRESYAVLDLEADYEYCVAKRPNKEEDSFDLMAPVFQRHYSRKVPRKYQGR